MIILSRTFSTNEKKVYPDGSAYEGEFNNEIENDRASLTHTTREGDGIMTYPDGSIYEGEWTCDHRNGKGKMTYPDGSIYKGEWSGDIAGVGKLTNPDGSIHHEGVWTGDEIDEDYRVEKLNLKMDMVKYVILKAKRNNQIIKFGTITYHDGVVFEG